MPTSGQALSTMLSKSSKTSVQADIVHCKTKSNLPTVYQYICSFRNSTSGPFSTNRQETAVDWLDFRPGHHRKVHPQIDLCLWLFSKTYFSPMAFKKVCETCLNHCSLANRCPSLHHDGKNWIRFVSLLQLCRQKLRQWLKKVDDLSEVAVFDPLEVEF